MVRETERDTVLHLRDACLIGTLVENAETTFGIAHAYLSDVCQRRAFAGLGNQCVGRLQRPLDHGFDRPI